MGQTKKRIIALPVLNVQLIPMDKVEPNSYNPNRMQHKIMKLLKLSIIEDGFLFPVLVIHDATRDLYVIVDGEHRYHAMKSLKAEHLPCIVLQRDISERRVMTERMNKTRGMHLLEKKKENFIALLEEGKFTLPELSQKMALEAEEIVIYKKKGSIVEEFKDSEFSNAWERDKSAPIQYKSKIDEYDDEEL
jgi:ParB-like chromosome segregation protein Spo0J